MATVALTTGQTRKIARTVAPALPRIAFIGDSLTNSTGPGTLGDKEYHAWAMLLSGGRIIHAGKYGEGGMGFPHPDADPTRVDGHGNSGGTFFTEAPINGVTRTAWLPLLLAANPLPDYAAILMGQNNLGNLTPAQIVAYYVDAGEQMQAKGMCPVFILPMPNDVALVDRFNVMTGLSATGARRGWPVVDLYSIADTNARWQAGDTGDGTHPTIQGARRAGQAVVDLLVPRLPYWTTPLAHDNINASSGLGNALQLTDTNSDGIPDGWQAITNSASGTTFETLDAGADAKGNWFHIHRTAATGTVLFRTQPRFAVSAGNRVSFSCVLKYANAEEAGSSGGSLNAAKLNMSLAGAVGPNVNDAAVGTLRTLFSLWQGNIAATPIYIEGVQPAGATHVYAEINLSAPTAGATSGVGDFYIAQPTFRDLTASGYVP